VMFASILIGSVGVSILTVGLQADRNTSPAKRIINRFMVFTSSFISHLTSEIIHSLMITKYYLILTEQNMNE